MAIDRMVPLSGALRAVAACAPAEHATNTQPHQQPGAQRVPGDEAGAPPPAADRCNPEPQSGTTTVVIVRRRRRRIVRNPA
jgi:hypothetical protein